MAASSDYLIAPSSYMERRDCRDNKVSNNFFTHTSHTYKYIHFSYLHFSPLPLSPVFSLFFSRGDDHANVCVLVPLTGIYRYVTGCDFLPIKQPKEVKLLSFNLAEQMPFMSNVRRINVDISRRLNDSPGLYGDSFGRKGAA